MCTDTKPQPTEQEETLEDYEKHVHEYILNRIDKEVRDGQGLQAPADSSSV